MRLNTKYVFEYLQVNALSSESPSSSTDASGNRYLLPIAMIIYRYDDEKLFITVHGSDYQVALEFAELLPTRVYF